MTHASRQQVFFYVKQMVSVTSRGSGLIWLLRVCGRVRFRRRVGEGVWIHTLRGRWHLRSHGAWANCEIDESSHWREFANVVEEALEEEAARGTLTNGVTCVFTGNSAVEAATCKGASTSRKLLALAIELKVIEVKHSTHLVACHVARTRVAD